MLIVWGSCIKYIPCHEFCGLCLFCSIPLWPVGAWFEAPSFASNRPSGLEARGDSGRAETSGCAVQLSGREKYAFATVEYLLNTFTHKSLHSFVDAHADTQTLHSIFWIALLQNLLITHDDVLKIADFGWFSTQIYPWTALRIHLSPRCQSDGVNEGVRMSIWAISWNWGPPNPQLRNSGQCQ